jgi:hypothetical protein
MLVPLSSTYTASPGAPATAVSCAPAAQDVMRSPGATRSGLRRPSPVGPFDEKYETPYVCGMYRWVDPTVIANCALPGSLIVIVSPTLVRRCCAPTVP